MKFIVGTDKWKRTNFSQSNPTIKVIYYMFNSAKIGILFRKKGYENVFPHRNTLKYTPK